MESSHHDRAYILEFRLAASGQLFRIRFRPWEQPFFLRSYRVSSCQSVSAFQLLQLNGSTSQLTRCSLQHSLNSTALVRLIRSPMCLKPAEAFRLTTVYPSLARLGLMMITPLTPRTPKIASDEGAFNTSIVSIFADFRILSGTTCVYNLYAGNFSLNGCPAGWQKTQKLFPPLKQIR